MFTISLMEGLRKQERLAKQNEEAFYKHMREKERNEQMTREEAINKLNAVSVNTDVNNIFVNRLEALGLIKFDEPKPETAEQLLRRCGYNSADRILMILSDNGYDVVKR